MKALKTENRISLGFIDEIIVQRRATSSFKSDPVPEETLQHLLKLASFAPSGFNLQPWRFIVVRDEENRKRLRKAAMNQAKVEEAPVVIIACADPTAWREDLEEVIQMGEALDAFHNGAAKTMKENTIKFLTSVDLNIWATKQTMVAYTHLMLLAEAYGLDTAPMEGFDATKVREAFAIPEEMLVLALLAIGYIKDENKDKPFGGRFSLAKTVSQEKFGTPWTE